ncbi:major facilitator superfamily domain-containing protein [Plectosphaerella plurivora]|uniref:Major facilitator superfamily domain-containing protein n=1 Tax=Plectosphaerella plurivora TaxID=936078 RepID=A0A9P8VB16_9PEZI|nr:major facilitator superfamily domain-containing protein [Plectosphaerella plurivora]
MAPATDEINPASATERRDEKTQDAGSDKGNSSDKAELVPTEMASSLPTEAIRRIWTRGPLIAVFCGLFMMNFSMVFAAASAGVYDPYATSHFEGHSLIATANIVHGIVRIVGYPLLAKVADHIGRPQGFAGAAIFMALANVLYAACRNVETYLAGGIFESFGDTWWTITEQIFIADTTSLINRGFLFTLPESLAALPTLYAGTYLGEHMLLNSSWRWGFGMWAAIMPFCALPTIAIMLFMERRGRKQGITYHRLPLRESSGIPEGASLGTKLYHILWIKLDIPGAFLLMAGLSMTLLPISISGRRNTERWSEPSSIILIVIGVLTFIGFLVWDGKFAKNPIVPLRLIKNRNVLLACASVCLIATSDSTYRAFASSFLQVAGGFSPGHAVRIDNARRVALNLGGLVIGIAIRFVKHTKPFIVIGCVMVALAAGLPIYFTNIDGSRVANEAALTTGQVILGLGRGFSQIPLQVALQAAVPDHEIGMATAFFLSSSGFGANLGNSISGAIWNTVLPRRLTSNLPESEQANAFAIFRSIVVAQKYEKGTAVREAINLSYRQTQQTLAIASLALAAPLLIMMLFNKNVKLQEEDEKRREAGNQAVEEPEVQQREKQAVPRAV